MLGSRRERKEQGGERERGDKLQTQINCTELQVIQHIGQYLPVMQRFLKVNNIFICEKKKQLKKKQEQLSKLN